MIAGSHDMDKNKVLDVEIVDFTPEAGGAGDFGTVLCSKSDSAGRAPDACCTSYFIQCYGKINPHIT